jgi:hypothetical protein
MQQYFKIRVSEAARVHALLALAVNMSIWMKIEFSFSSPPYHTLENEHYNSYVRSLRLPCAYLISALPGLILVGREWNGFDADSMNPNLPGLASLSHTVEFG